MTAGYAAPQPRTRAADIFGPRADGGPGTTRIERPGEATPVRYNRQVAVVLRSTLLMTWQWDKPILGVAGFNLLTLFVFVTAPLDWQTDNVFGLCAFVLLCQAVVVFGFGLGRHGGRAAPKVKPPFFDADNLIRLLVTVYVLTFPISYAYRMDFGPFDIAGMVSRLMTGLEDPRVAYSSTLARSAGGPIPWSVYFAVAVFDQLFFAAGFLHWRRFGRASKVLFAVFVAIELFFWVGRATTFGVIALATTWAMSTMYWPVRDGRRGGRRQVSTLPILALLLVGCIAFFSYNLYRRANFAQLDVDQFETSQTLQAPLIREHPVFTIVPQALWPTYLMVVSYMAQGYYHTCLAFDLDFRSTGLIGNNPALISLAGAFGISVWEDSYMHRLHPGIDEFGVWHSAYMWYASDVSFFGVPVVLFILGYLFGFSWALGLHGDFLSRIVFVIFGNMLLFLFANNTYLASVFYAFMVFVPFWMFTRFAAVVFGEGQSGFALPASGVARR